MKKCLVVIDYQNDFVTGALGFKEALEIKSVIIDLINEYHANGNQVIFTKDTHNENYIKTEEGKHLPIMHCIKDTIGHELEKDVLNLVKKDDLIFEKDTFGSSKLYEYLKKNYYDCIEFVGIVTNICVLSNAILAKTANSETKIIIIENGVASNDVSLNQACLNIFKSLGMEVIHYGN